MNLHVPFLGSHITYISKALSELGRIELLYAKYISKQLIQCLTTMAFSCIYSRNISPRRFFSSTFKSLKDLQKRAKLNNFLEPFTFLANQTFEFVAITSLMLLLSDDQSYGIF
jgi:hypothetical protein